MTRYLPCLALLLSAWSAPALAQTPCTEIASLPAILSAPGTYCLAANHTVDMTTGNAITIAANDVDLDCAASPSATPPSATPIPPPACISTAATR